MPRQTARHSTPRHKPFPVMCTLQRCPGTPHLQNLTKIYHTPGNFPAMPPCSITARLTRWNAVSDNVTYASRPHYHIASQLPHYHTASHHSRPSHTVLYRAKHTFSCAIPCLMPPHPAVHFHDMPTIECPTSSQDLPSPPSFLVVFGSLRARRVLCMAFCRAPHSQPAALSTYNLRAAPRRPAARRTRGVSYGYSAPRQGCQE